MLGAATAYGWMALGSLINARFDPRAAFVVVWFLYLSGSAVFISRKMRGWLGEYRAL